MSDKQLVQSESDSEEWECPNILIVQNRYNPRNKDLGDEQQLRSYLYQQLINDPILGASVSSHLNLIEYMVNNKYTDVYEYLKVCNKQGLLFDTLVNKYFKIVKNQPKYNHIQCMKIHQQNLDQRQLQKTTIQILEIKQQRKMNKNQQKEKKEFENFTMLCDPVEERKRIAEMIRQQNEEKQQENQNNAPPVQVGMEEEDQQKDQTADWEPLDQEIDEEMVKNSLREYQKMYESLLMNFQPTQYIQVEQEETQIDFRNLSDDSLEPFFNEPPQQRQNKMEVMHFSFKMIPIKVVQKQLVINNNNNI